jgi:hypothetical protein
LTGKVEALGETTIELKLIAALLTVRAAVDFRLTDRAAVMVTVPGADPLAIPVEFTLAMFASEELH